MGRRRRNNASSIIRDVAHIASKVGWQGALVLGAASFILFYFILPLWFTSILEAQNRNTFYAVIEAVIGRRTHWLQWVGIACGLLGLFFSVRNYHYGRNARSGERGLAAFLAKLLGRALD